MWTTELEAKGISIGDLKWRTSQEAPLYTEDPEVAVVLSPFLGSVQETFDWYERIAFSQQPNTYHQTSFRTDAVHLRMWNQVPFEANSIGWSRIQLNANVMRSPRNVRKLVNSLPGLEIVATVAQHPARVVAMNGTVTRPYLWMGGLEVAISDIGPWSGVPFVWHRAVARELSINVSDYGAVDMQMTVPVFV